MTRHLLHPNDTADTEVEDREPVTQRSIATREEMTRERFGGVNPGAAFFGWLVAVGVTILLAGILGAVAAAIGETAD